MPGIPPFNPHAPRGPFYRAVQAFIRTRTGRTLAINFAARTDPLLLKWSQGRFGTGLVMPTAALTTTGARSGVRRTAAVLYFTDGDRDGSPPDVILIASNFGRERHPSWYYNLTANPEAELERSGITARYRAALVEDAAEYSRLFALANKIYSGYDDYRIRTEAVGRRIPIFRLKLV